MEGKFCIKCKSQATHQKFDSYLCTVCFRFSPNREEDFKQYVQEKIDGKLLETFRKYENRDHQQKKGMIKKASQGKLMSRVPFGYLLEKGELIPAVNHHEIEEIFEEFLNSDVSLNRLAKKHNLSTNGLKKILKNFTYIGKVKFNNQIFEGKHQPIISSTLFNHVQNKLENMKIK